MFGTTGLTILRVRKSLITDYFFFLVTSCPKVLWEVLDKRCLRLPWVLNGLLYDRVQVFKRRRLKYESFRPNTFGKKKKDKQTTQTFDGTHTLFSTRQSPHYGNEVRDV